MITVYTKLFSWPNTQKFIAKAYDPEKEEVYITQEGSRYFIRVNIKYIALSNARTAFKRSGEVTKLDFVKSKITTLPKPEQDDLVQLAEIESVEKALS